MLCLYLHIEKIQHKAVDIDGKEGDEEEKADADQNEVCPLESLHLPLLDQTRSWRPDGPEVSPDVGVEAADGDQRHQELEQAHQGGVHQVARVIPVL